MFNVIKNNNLNSRTALHPTINEDNASSILKTLKFRLKSNNNRTYSLNSYFEHWYEHIDWNLRARLVSGGVSYDYGLDYELFNECQKHSSKYNKEINTNNIILITHPFYLPLSHIKYLKSLKDIGHVKEYINLLMDLFEINKQNDNVGFIILDTIHHYAASTSLLLERGLVDKIIFTQHDDGYPVRKSELLQMCGKNIFVGGGYYRGGCLSRSIEMINEVVKPNEKLYAICDLIINTPRGMTLSPVLEDFKKEGFPESRIINKKQLIEMIEI